MRTITSSFAKFHNDASGSVAILFGVGCIAFFLFAGLAIDSARYYNLSSKIQDSLDAAALTGAKELADDSMSNGDITTLTRKNFNAAIASLGIKTVHVSPLEVTIDRTNATVEAKSKVVVRSMFGALAFLPREIPVTRTSKVVYDLRKVELSLVLDITGSMNDKNKIKDMKSAAGDVVDALFKDAINEDGVRIAVAPYSASVNAGALANIVSAVPPVTTCTFSWFGRSCKTAAGLDVDTCVIERQGTNAATDAAPLGIDKLPSVPSLPYGNYSCPPSTVIPLLGKSQAQTIKDTIDDYVAVGSTAGHIGAAWGWYLLSPNWSSVLPSASVPAAYEDKTVTKATLIMTDGLFNTSYLSGPTTDYATQSNESYARFRELCDGIKAKGITVYTVGFDLADPRAISELQNCASGSSNFFDAKTGAQLKKAFKSVADKLNTLRVAS